MVFMLVWVGVINPRRVGGLGYSSLSVCLCVCVCLSLSLTYLVIASISGCLNKAAWYTLYAHACTLPQKGGNPCICGYCQ